MIPTRVDKLKFLADEMLLAFHLTTHLTEPFVARVLARHILIRAVDFIDMRAASANRRFCCRKRA